MQMADINIETNGIVHDSRIVNNTSPGKAFRLLKSYFPIERRRHSGDVLEHFYESAVCRVAHTFADTAYGDVAIMLNIGQSAAGQPHTVFVDEVAEVLAVDGVDGLGHIGAVRAYNPCQSVQREVGIAEFGTVVHLAGYRRSQLVALFVVKAASLVLRIVPFVIRKHFLRF